MKKLKFYYKFTVKILIEFLLRADSWDTNVFCENPDGEIYAISPCPEFRYGYRDNDNKVYFSEEEAPVGSEKIIILSLQKKDSLPSY